MAPRPLQIVILNPNSTQSMTDEMVAVGQVQSGSAAVIVGLTNSKGPAAIQGREDAKACLPGLFALFEQAQADGADAVIIGCFDDTGLAELRARKPLPVIGLGEAGCIAGTLASSRFAVVTSLPISVPVIEENIQAMGLWDRCAGVYASGVAVLALNEGAESLAQVQRGIDAIAAKTPKASIVLGCGGMSVIAPHLRPPPGVQVIDPVRAAVHMALAAVTVRAG